MPRFARSIQIEVPPADVWAVMIDIEAWPTWASQFKRLETLDPGPLRKGSRVQVRPKSLPAATWEVTEYEDGRSGTWATTRAEFSLEAGRALGRLLEPILRRIVFSGNTRNATEGLKRHVEGHAAR